MTQQSQEDVLDARKRLLNRIPVTELHLQLAGVSTAVLEGGDGPPMVLLHGPGESSLWSGYEDVIRRASEIPRPP